MTAINTDLAIRDNQDQVRDLMPMLSIEQAIQRYNAVLEFAKKVMKPGRDYGVIPGTERKNADGTPDNSNNTLLKPGAEKLCTLFGMVPHFEDYRVVEDWDRGLFYYGYRCVLSRGGRVVADMIGSANSWEKKYRRSVRLCPECNAPAIKRSKYPPRGNTNAAPGWYCHEKSGGCGANFDFDDPQITDQKMTSDPREAADLINTLQKMAQKRALVAATLIATNASEFFTQDVEDSVPVADYIDGEVVEPDAPAARPQRQSQPPQSEQQQAWDKFCEMHADKTPDDLKKLWTACLKDYFGASRRTSLTDAEWKQFASDEFDKRISNPKEAVAAVAK